MTKTLKEKNKELMAELKKIYRRGRLVYYDEKHSHVIIKPFKHSNMEFGIFIDDELNQKMGKYDSFIMRTPNFDTAEHGDNDAKIYDLKDTSSIDAILKRLAQVIKIYVQEQQEFYNEGKKIERYWTNSEEEAIKLASVIYEKCFLKELGIKL